ncbi:hypothetical protein UK23_46515 [Lentzea aerocolonigenes]|uniref:Uncharacterized protein n=1 Tax=Lentzea aerocolonigenes TaxID=68170 RepID=A0A0F0GB72_LENAE|nr:hypothetical protein UK23_46515 [Lentzea aerocolonigenes]
MTKGVAFERRPFRLLRKQKEPQPLGRRVVRRGVRDEQLVRMSVHGELLNVERELARHRVVVGLHELARPADLVRRPPRAEVRVAHAELADESGEDGIVRRAARLHPQHRDAFTGRALPVAVQCPERRVEERQPDQVARGRFERLEIGQQRRGCAVPRQDVHAAVQDHRRDVRHAVEQLPQPRGDLGSRFLPDRGDIGEREQVLALVGRQLQRVRQRVEHGAGDPVGAALFEPDDVVDADVGELGQLLAAQAGHAALPAVVGKARAVRVESGAAGAEELAQFGHAPSVRGCEEMCLVLVCIGWVLPGWTHARRPAWWPWKP